MQGHDARSRGLRSSRVLAELRGSCRGCRRPSRASRQSTLEDFVAKTINLDIHLSSGDTVSGTRYLEVHITEVVFVTEDVGEDRVVRTLVLRDQTHGDTRYGLSDGSKRHAERAYQHIL